MSDLNDYKLGEAIQNYVRRKWRLREQWRIEDAKGIELDDHINERVFSSASTTSCCWKWSRCA
jgi:hypothetical protein